MPFALVPFLLLAIPIAEIGAFIVIGGEIGVMPTLLMILVTAIIGSFFLRHQGLGLINKIKSETAAGKVPGKALGEGAMIVVAGILLLTPGFITDSLGFLLFVPFVRSAIWGFVASRITVVGPGGFEPFGQNRESSPYSEESAGSGPVIDLDEEDFQSRPAEDENSGPGDKNSPWNNNRESQ